MISLVDAPYRLTLWISLAYGKRSAELNDKASLSVPIGRALPIASAYGEH